MKKSANEVIGFVIIFSVLFGIFVSSYYFLYPLIKKTKSKSELKAIENDLIELTEKISRTIETKSNQYMTFIVQKGLLTIDHSVFGIKYTVTLPYSPYTNYWYDVLNGKPASIDVCNYENEGQTIQMKDCLAAKLHAQCKKIGENAYNCYFPVFNINIQYYKIRKKDLGQNAEGYVYISSKPMPKLINNNDICSLYVQSLYSKEREKLNYYIICNVRKVDNTCYIPRIEGNLVASPVTTGQIVISYEGEDYLPNFNYFGCSEAYIENIKVNLIRR